MIPIFRRVAPLFVFLTIALTNSAFSNILDGTQFGGEIPWPLSVQHVVTVENSKGLWKLSNKKQTRLFNVEMAKDSRSGFDWIRVAEMDPKTYKVLSWGEGFFTPSKLPGTPESSFSNILLGWGQKIGGKDKLGRYISMFPNGDLDEKPYLLRMVEVESSLGTGLGLSFMDLTSKKFDHMLGSRVQDEPFSCINNDKTDQLECFFDF